MINKIIENENLCVYAGNGKDFLGVENGNGLVKSALKPPVFEIDYKTMGGNELIFLGVIAERSLLNGGVEKELCYELSRSQDIKLKLLIRYFPDSPFIRFKYSLMAEKPYKMTKEKGNDNILYFGITMANNEFALTEVQFSQYDSLKHCFLPNIEYAEKRDSWDECSSFAGPIMIVEHQEGCYLLAYEHGAEYPDSFLNFTVATSNDITDINLNALKGNYYDGQVINSVEFFETPWFHFAFVNENKDYLLRKYREFFLKFISENLESRKPYIYYNTWNYQERVKIFKKGKYLDSMNLEHILKEIEIAHQMGVDVFVIDTGWYNKTGDWVVDEKRFPDKLVKVKEKLTSFGMKLGLWFNPIVAARTSEIYLAHPEYAMAFEGEICDCGSIWETEESYGMCLASGYSDYYIQKLIRLYNELGVTYFKWDGIGQYGCDSPDHFHGTMANTSEERQANYSFKMGLEMIRIVEEVTKACPEAIFDFDITEGGRFVGLGFLSVGKYFHMNNGPYFNDFDIPENVNIDPNTINVFFHAGVARSRACRQFVHYDKIVPSILFLTHFFPDAYKTSQVNSLSSLMLGGNGIWGDLLSLSNEDIKLFKENIQRYKSVAESVTSSYPRTKGFIGSSPEIYEKILPQAASGIVTFFTRAEGCFEYTTQKIDINQLGFVEGVDSYSLTSDGRLILRVSLVKDEARTVYILSKEK